MVHQCPFQKQCDYVKLLSIISFIAFEFINLNNPNNRVKLVGLGYNGIFAL